MSEIVIRLLGGVTRHSFERSVVGRQAIIDGLRVDIEILEKRLDILNNGAKDEQDES